MYTVFFVDTDPGTAKAWEDSFHNKVYQACPFAPFSGVAETAKLVNEQEPSIVVIAPNLGTTRGMNVFYDLRVVRKFQRPLMINGPQGGKTDERCTPDQLRKLIDNAVKLSSMPLECKSALKEAIIQADGSVKCPHTRWGMPCSGRRFVGTPGEYTCYTCTQAFLAVSKPGTSSAPELKKAVMASDGWVPCPHDGCGNWKNVLNKPGVYECTACDKKFEAVADEPKAAETPTNSTGGALTAKAFNTFGDVKCPKCGKTAFDVVPYDEEKEVTCESMTCNATFTALPYQATNAANA